MLKHAYELGIKLAQLEDTDKVAFEKLISEGIKKGLTKAEYLAKGRAGKAVEKGPGFFERLFGSGGKDPAAMSRARGRALEGGDATATKAFKKIQSKARLKAESQGLA